MSDEEFAERVKAALVEAETRWGYIDIARHEFGELADDLIAIDLELRRSESTPELDK